MTALIIGAGGGTDGINPRLTWPAGSGFGAGSVGTTSVCIYLFMIYKWKIDRMTYLPI
jgi:hypothetical protein